ncbi:hypothetical protein GXW82_00550 [Streptacidiphilus sp. 4-A2]|nr:hypothetical protein [Streptacidiphilus sp. 4-A2]
MSMSQSTPPLAPGQAPPSAGTAPAPAGFGPAAYGPAAAWAPQQPQPRPSAPAPQPQAAGARAPGLGGALASEWIKLWSTRSGYSLMAVLALLSLGSSCLLATHYSGESQVFYYQFLEVASPGAVLAVFLTVPFSALVITSDYGTGMLRTTFIVSPRRARVLTAKALIVFGVIFVLGSVSSGLTLLLTHTVIPGNFGVATDRVSSDQLGKAVFGSALYLALGLLTLALGAILRHSAGTITLMLGLVFLPFVGGIFAGHYTWGTDLMAYSPIGAVTSFFGVDLVGTMGNTTLSLAIPGGFAALALCCAYVLVTTRDV